MLPKPNRLSKDQDFKKIFKLGKMTRHNFLILRWVKNNLTFSRFGFVVSNKISSRAAVRHRIKRRLRECVRTKLKKINTGYDCVILTTLGIKEKNFQEINEAVDRLLKRAKLLNDPAPFSHRAT